MNDTTTAATTWRDTEPTQGAVGRLVLTADRSVVLPVSVEYLEGRNVSVQIGGSSTSNIFRKDDWTFQVEQPPLPTTPGSVIRWFNDFDDSDNLLVLDDRGQWGNADYAPPMSRITTWEIVSDAGPVTS